MAKVQTQKVDKNTRYRMIGDFYDIVTHLKSKNEVVGFFMGLLTSSEALMLARRIQIAQMILSKKSYESIREELGVGHSTITNIARWLYGKNEHFHEQIQNHMKRKSRRNKKESEEGRYYDSILDRYPGHRILKDILDL